MALVIKRPVEAMALMEALLQRRKAKIDPSARAIEFKLGTETWSFDPSRKGARFEQSKARDAALTVVCTPQVLGRLLTHKQFYLEGGEELRLIGDRTALNPLVEALGGKAR